MFLFEELRVYKDALHLVDLVYEMVMSWPKDEQFGLVDQIRRSTVSIALNIAEGSSRTKKDFGHFLDMARGSCYESATIATIAKRRSYITEHQFNDFYTNLNDISRSINALKKSLYK